MSDRSWMRGVLAAGVPLPVLLTLAACGSQPAPVAAATSAPTAVATIAAAAPSPSPTATPIPASTPTPAPAVAAGAPTPAPAPAAPGTRPPYDAGQHPLGPIGAPGAGVHTDPTLNWQGCGSTTLPAGTARFFTGNNWQLGYSTTCPNSLNYGAGGMGPNVTFNELLIGGGTGPDSAGGAGPWTDSGTSLMAHGGNYQIRVTAIDPRCRWHVAVYPS